MCMCLVILQLSTGGLNIPQTLVASFGVEDKEDSSDAEPDKDAVKREGCHSDVSGQKIHCRQCCLVMLWTVQLHYG